MLLCNEKNCRRPINYKRHKVIRPVFLLLLKCCTQEHFTELYNNNAESVNIFFVLLSVFLGPDKVVGIATGYGLDGPGIESRWGKIFRTCPDRPCGPPSPLYNGYRLFPGVKSGQGVRLTPNSLLVPWS